jgi:hypothetical protein
LEVKKNRPFLVTESKELESFSIINSLYKEAVSMFNKIEVYIEFPVVSNRKFKISIYRILTYEDRLVETEIFYDKFRF